MRKTNSWMVVLLIVVITVLAGPCAWAQTNRATITGTVTDSSGAMLVGVEVTATNKDTGVASKTVSNQDGIYVIPDLFPGMYALSRKMDSKFCTVLR